MQGTQVTGGGRLRIAVPWFADAVRAAPDDGGQVVRVPAAEWLLARADRAAAPSMDWRQWLVRDCGLGEDAMRQLPAGPCAYAALHGSLPTGTWACARLVHLLTGLDHLQLSPERLELDEEESATLLADINRHFAGAGMRFHRSRGDSWLLECDRSLACTTVEPALAAGRNLRELMPGGPDGARVRSLMNELQMLLHEHAVNEQRERRGEPPVNSLWLWGFGAAAPPAPVSLPRLFTDDPWLTGLWTAHGADSHAVVDFAPSIAAAGTGLLGWSAAPVQHADDCLLHAESTCFLPARAALESGRASGIDLLAGESVYSIARRGRLAFWKRARPLAVVVK